MRYTLSPMLHLSRLPLPTRVVLTCFIVLIEAALVVGARKYTDRADFTPAGATRYFRGDAGSAESAEDDGSGHPEPLLPGENLIDSAAAPEASPPKSTRFLVDVVHPHLFTVPIVQFILLHLLILTRLSDRVKIALTLHGFGATAATFGLPFVLAAGGGGAAWFILAGANLLLSFAGVGCLLLVELWRPAAIATPTATRSGRDEVEPDRPVV
jgi:hypothetical protein